MLYIVVGIMLVCLAVSAVLWDRGRRREARWGLGITALLAANVLLYELIRLVRSV